MRALISRADFAPIPDGTLLYTCTARVPSDAAVGTYPLVQAAVGHPPGDMTVRQEQTRKEDVMAIHFSFAPEIDALRLKVRDFTARVVRPAEARIAEREGDRRFLIQSIIEMRVGAHE